MLSPPLRDVLDHWPPTTGDVQVVLAPSGFSGAGILRVTSANGTWCLRRWPGGATGLPPARIRELHRWLAFLSSAGVTQVAVPVASRDGSTLVVAHGSQWQLEPWLPGCADFHQRPSDARLRNAATTLARLHLAAERYVPLSEGTPWFSCGEAPAPAVVERWTRLREYIVPHRPKIGRHVHQAQRDLASVLTSTVGTLAPQIAAELKPLAGVSVRLHPCLRDVWHDHILFTGDEVTGIVDPSAARTENVASDLSRLFGSLLADAGRRWATALDAYAELRPLSADERRLVPALDRSGIVLSAAHWLERMAIGELSAREWERVQQLSARCRAIV